MLSPKRKKAICSAIAVVFVTGAVFAAGFHFGPTSAVKRRVKELDLDSLKCQRWSCLRDDSHRDMDNR